jgi:hypothetical protein
MSRSGDQLRVTFDLGSAPVDALLELLQVFEEMGATEGLLFSPPAG